MNRFKQLLVLLLLALFSIGAVQAQEEESDEVGVALLITPKAGHDEALLTAIEGYHKWVANYEGHMRFSWWKILTGPETGNYMAYSGGHNWADMDAEYDWEDESDKVIAENVMPHIEHMVRAVDVGMDDVSHWPDNWEGYTHIQLESWYIKNGHYGAFNKGMKRISAALKAGEYPAHFGFTRTVSGGHGNEITLVLPMKGWSGMSEKNPSFYDIMSEELGGQEQFDAFMSEWGQTFKSGHSQMLEYLPAASDYGD